MTDSIQQLFISLPIFCVSSLAEMLTQHEKKNHPFLLLLQTTVVGASPL